MGFVLTLLGMLSLLLSLAAVGLGVFMLTNPNTRELGGLFALWWIPAVAAASGILMRDLVTFVVGLACFLVAGLVFVASGIVLRSRRARRADRWAGARKSKGLSGKSGGRKTAS